MTSSTKRSAPEGTPDREARARAKFELTQRGPQVFVPEASDPLKKSKCVQPPLQHSNQ